MASFDFAPLALALRYACPELVEGLRTNGGASADFQPFVLSVA